MSRGTGMGKRPVRRDPAVLPARPSPLSPATHALPTRRRPGRHAADGHEVDLDAYIAKMLDDAPPLTSEQRDRLALLLRGQRPQVDAPASPAGSSRLACPSGGLSS